MRELERFFTILEGRLAFSSHMLGELEEESLDALIKAENIEELFGDFHRFSLAAKAERRLDCEMVHKIGGIMRKLETLRM
jgi:hypothetical protein